MTTRQRIAAVLAQVLGHPVDAGREFTREQAPGWDSLNHLRIVMAVEEEFGVRLEPEDVVTVGSLSDLVRLVERPA
jgi:acyl carrier protein